MVQHFDISGSLSQQADDALHGVGLGGLVQSALAVTAAIMTTGGLVQSAHAVTEAVAILPTPLMAGSSTDHVTSQALAAAPEVAGVLGSALGGPIAATGARLLCGAALGLYSACTSRVPPELRF